MTAPWRAFVLLLTFAVFVLGVGVVKVQREVNQQLGILVEIVDILTMHRKLIFYLHGLDTTPQDTAAMDWGM